MLDIFLFAPAFVLKYMELCFSVDQSMKKINV